MPKLKASGAKRVWLQPFMIVAGDHANSLARPEEDSWASRIKAAGMTPCPTSRASASSRAFRTSSSATPRTPLSISPTRRRRIK
ncbi:MAG: sirohydrochlorin cobaltochelatase [Bilophila wadsworthia]